MANGYPEKGMEGYNLLWYSAGMALRSLTLVTAWTALLLVLCDGMAAFADSPLTIVKGDGGRGFLTIAAVGDVMMGSVSPVTVLPPNDGAGMFDGVREYLKGDIVFGNLEGPMVEGEQPRKCRKNGAYRSNCFEFSMHPRYGQHLADAGFTVMNIANNHAYDFGERGVTSTVDTLAGVRISAAGCGRIARSEIRGKDVVIVGFTFSPATSPWGSLLDIDGAKKMIRSLKNRHGLVIVSFHGGAEGKDALHVTGKQEAFAGEQRGNVREFARGVVDAGADLVIGHGPHVVRAMEIYKKKLIAYSLGNFLTYGMFNLKGPNGLGMVLQVKIDSETGDFLSGRIVPVILEQRGLPAVDPEGGSINLVKLLTLEDLGERAIGIGVKGELFPIR